MIRIALAGPSEIEREGVKRRLSGEEDIFISGEASCERDLLAVLRNDKFDVLVLDLGLARQQGFRLIRQARTVTRRLPILVFTESSEPDVGVRSIRAGARGLLAKDATTAEAITSVRAVASGAFYVPPQLVEQLAISVIQRGDTSSHVNLSERDFAIFSLLASGVSVTDIAHTLGLSVRTVGVRKSKIMQRMSLGSVSSIVQYAIKHGLIRPDSCN